MNEKIHTLPNQMATVQGKGILMDEIWKEINGFDGRYAISSNGRIKILKGYGQGRIKKVRTDKDGYKSTTLFDGTKYHICRVHRAVAKAFIPNPGNLPCVNHKDEDKSNNVSSNLEWCSVSYNNNYGTRTKRMAKTQSGKERASLWIPVLGEDIHTGVKLYFQSAKDAEKQLGIDRAHICWCCKGKRKTAGGYTWKYVKAK